jgi:hypothetical protein
MLAFAGLPLAVMTEHALRLRVLSRPESHAAKIGPFREAACVLAFARISLILWNSPGHTRRVRDTSRPNN